MSNKNVIVTGGAGYVGSHACKALAAAGFTPVTYDNLSIGNNWAVRWGPLEVGDILDSARVNEVFYRYNPVAVMHFAALALVGESVQEPARYYNNNVSGTMNLLDACRIFNARKFVFSSTCATYGVPKNVPITEQSEQAPVNPYGASKLMVEQMLRDYDSAYGIKHVALRYFNAAGGDPEMEIGECRKVETHLIPLLLQAILKNKPIKIMGTDYPTPDGTAVRDYIHVDDLAFAHVNAIEHMESGGDSAQVNLGTGVGLSVKEIVKLAEDVTGQRVLVDLSDRRAGDPPELVADNSTALNGLLKNRDLYSPEDIVRHAWYWHQKMSQWDSYR